MNPQSRLQAAVPRRQRGAGSLIVMMLLLFSASVVAFYLNRNLLVEQKVSANQVRSTTAFEVAEAGLEWAVGMLNTPTDINTTCAADTSTNVSFRKKYIQTGATGAVSAATTTFPGCKVSGSTLTCSCPAVPGSGEAVASLGTTSLPSFTVAFENVQVNGVQDTEAVRITATGCTAQAGACKPATTSAATTGSSDAWAQVSQIVKARPLLRAVPASALTCGTTCSLGGSYNLINTDLSTNGATVNAGSTIDVGSASVTTLPGQPVANSQIGNDSTLAAVANNDLDCSDSAMFKTFFGSTLAEYIVSPDVKSIPGCTEPSACGALINTAVNEGYKDLYFPDGISLNSSSGLPSLGTSGAGNGVTIVSPGAIDINGNITIYGMVFSNSATFNGSGSGTANIFGAMITCAGYTKANGDGTLKYDSDALGGRDSRRGPMVRVPGSWRDFTP